MPTINDEQTGSITWYCCRGLAASRITYTYTLSIHTDFNLDAQNLQFATHTSPRQTNTWYVHNFHACLWLGIQVVVGMGTTAYDVTNPC